MLGKILKRKQESEKTEQIAEEFANLINKSDNRIELYEDFYRELHYSVTEIVQNVAFKWLDDLNMENIIVVPGIALHFREFNSEKPSEKNLILPADLIIKRRKSAYREGDIICFTVDLKDGPIALLRRIEKINWKDGEVAVMLFDDSDRDGYYDVEFSSILYSVEIFKFGTSKWKEQINSLGFNPNYGDIIDRIKYSIKVNPERGKFYKKVLEQRIEDIRTFMGITERVIKK